MIMVPTPRRQLLFILLLFSFTRMLYTLTFNTEGCGVTKGCYAFPSSCTTSENCNFLITYNATSPSKVEFELSGKGNWIAVGFSDDQLMANTDILMCVSNPALSGHYNATSRMTPLRTSTTPSAIKFIEVEFKNEIIKCRVSRDINATTPNLKDLNQAVFLLAAHGNLTGSTLERHTNRGASNETVMVTQANSTVTRFQPAPQGSFRIPDGCADTNCDFLVKYQASGNDKVVFELRGKGKWAGVGFSEDPNMPNTDMLICASDGLSGHYYATGRSTPKKTDPTPSAVEITDQSFKGGLVFCRITRVVDPKIDNFRNLNQEWFLLGGVGDVQGGSIQIHNTKGSTSAKVSVRSGVAATSTQGDIIPTKVLVHAILMTLAWTLFAFVGLFTARYMREVWEPRKLLGEKAWFTVHRTLMTITLLLTITATVLIFVYVDGWSSTAGAHPYCGIVAIVFALAQPIMAAFRPHPGAPRRGIFNWSHRIVGTIALVMAVVSIYLGLDLGKIGLGKQGLWAVVTFYIGEFLIFVFEAYLIFSKRNKEKRTVSMDNTSDIRMETPGHQTQAQPDEMPMKEAMIRSFMFVFVVLLGSSVALTIILLLVLK